MALFDSPVRFAKDFLLRVNVWPLQDSKANVIQGVTVEKFK